MTDDTHSSNPDWIVRKVYVVNGSLQLQGVNLNCLGTIDENFSWNVDPKYVVDSKDRYDLSNAEISPEAMAELTKVGVLSLKKEVQQFEKCVHCGQNIPYVMVNGWCWDCLDTPE